MLLWRMRVKRISTWEFLNCAILAPTKLSHPVSIHTTNTITATTTNNKNNNKKKESKNKSICWLNLIKLTTEFKSVDNKNLHSNHIAKWEDIVLILHRRTGFSIEAARTNVEERETKRLISLRLNVYLCDFCCGCCSCCSFHRWRWLVIDLFIVIIDDDDVVVFLLRKKNDTKCHGACLHVWCCVRLLNAMELAWDRCLVIGYVV